METSMGWWDWVGIAGFFIGMVAFLMTVQPFTQAIWGKPHITVDTATGNIDVQHPYLEFVIRNEPVTGGILAFLGVSRDTLEEAFASIQISEYQTNRIIVPSFWPRLVKVGSGQNGAQRVSIPGSEFGVSAAVIIGNEGRVFAAVDGETPNLDPGEYVAEIAVGGLKRTVNHARRFTVRTKGTFYWV